MLVFALQFSRCARHDVEAKARRTSKGTAGQCLPHVAAAEAVMSTGVDVGLVLGVEGNSLKTEEKTRSVERNMVKR